MPFSYYVFPVLYYYYYVPTLYSGPFFRCDTFIVEVWLF